MVITYRDQDDINNGGRKYVLHTVGRSFGALGQAQAFFKETQ